MSWDYWNVYSDTSLTVPLDKNNYDFTAGTNTASARIKNMNWGNCIGPLQARYVNCLCYLFYAKVSGYCEFCESVHSLIFATQLMYTALLGIRGTWALLAKFIFSKIHANGSGNGLCSSLCQTTVALSDTGRLCPSTGTKLYLLLGVWTTCLRLCLKAKRPCVRTVTFEFWVQCLAITISYRDCKDLAWKPFPTSGMTATSKWTIIFHFSV